MSGFLEFSRYNGRRALTESDIRGAAPKLLMVMCGDGNRPARGFGLLQAPAPTARILFPSIPVTSDTYRPSSPLGPSGFEQVLRY